MTAANGTKIAVLGEVTMPFKVGTYSGVVTAVVSEHVTEVMLGIGWLMQNEVMWEFSKSRMRIDGVYILFIDVLM